MFIKNYTSSVPVSQTIHRIERVLIQCGATGIMKEYDPTGKVLALTFKIRMGKDDPRETLIRLPANERAAMNALWVDYAGADISQDGAGIAWGSRKNKKRSDFKEQGERTAWKLMQDWVEVQLSMVQLDQAEMLQVFLPYAWDGQRTYFDVVRANAFKGFLPEKASDNNSSVKSKSPEEPVDAEVVA